MLPPVHDWAVSETCRRVLMTYQHLDQGVDPFSEECLPADPDPFHEHDPRDDLEDWQR